MVSAANPYRDQRTQYDPGMGMDELCDALNLGLYIGVLSPSGSAPISSDIISFLQSGIGARTDKTAQEKMREIVSIDDFKDTGDSHSDACQKAVDALLTGNGGIVYTGRGDLTWDGVVTLTDGRDDAPITIQGAGTGSFNDTSTHATRILNGNNSHAFSVGSNGGVAFRDFSILDTLGAATRTAGAGIFADRTDTEGNVSLECTNVFVYGHQDGFNFVRPILTKLTKCTAYQNERDGFRLDVSGGGSHTSVVFDNCFAWDNGQDGYAVDGGNYISFLGTACDENGRYGYYVHNTGGANPTGITFIGVGAENNTDDQIRVSNATGVTILGGTISSGDDDGIYLDTVSGATIISPKLTSNTGYGINVNAGGDITVINPHFISNTAGTINDPGSVVTCINAPSGTGFRAPAGTAAVPSISFQSDPDTGFYVLAANQLGVTVAGARVARITSSGVLPADASAADLGSTSLPWRRLLVSTSIRGLLTTNGPAGVATLAAGAATTTINNNNVTASSLIYLFPTSANAAADVGSAGGVYISALVASTSFTITHPNNANADKTFNYLIVN